MSKLQEISRKDKERVLEEPDKIQALLADLKT